MNRKTGNQHANHWKEMPILLDLEQKNDRGDQQQLDQDGQKAGPIDRSGRGLGHACWRCWHHSCRAFMMSLLLADQVCDIIR